MYYDLCFDITCNCMQEKCVYLDLINHAWDKICTYRVLQLKEFAYYFVNGMHKQKNNIVACKITD